VDESADAQKRRDFEELVAQAIDELPEKFFEQLDNVAIVVEDEPPSARTLGLYEGIEQPRRGRGYSGVLPDLITIYRGPLERMSRTREELAGHVRHTVFHEIAHHFGISDDRMRDLGVY
jgi:predicted Zn-dependent protease with MMP-like domain